MQPDAIGRAAGWAGIDLDEDQRSRLRALADWIEREAIPAGGVGPNESGHVVRRHVADSLCFAAAWRGSTTPDTIADLGSGAGLPAVPLAIAFPGSTITAVDRAGRRCMLTKRAARVVGVDNLEVVQTDFTRWEGEFDAVVSRAAMDPLGLHPHLQRLTAHGGTAVVGGSHASAPSYPGYEVIEIPTDILENPAWLLKMARP